MRQFKFTVALLTAAILAGCGGGGGGDQTTKIKFSSQVSFGDSLSDVGKFKGDEIVFVFAGGNDAGQLLDELTIGATAAATAAVTAAVPTQIGKDIASGACVPTDAQASNCVAGAVATLTPTVGAAAAG